MRSGSPLVAFVVAALVAACGGSEHVARIPPMPPSPESQVSEPQFEQPEERLQVASDVAQRLSKFAVHVMDFDDSKVPAEQRVVIKKLVEASQLMHELFIEQIDPGIFALRTKLAKGSSAPALRYFDIMAGPWDALAHDEPFVGEAKRPQGGTFYPSGMAKQEFESFVAAHEGQKDLLEGYFTVIRRDDEGLRAVPYSEAYADKLRRASQLLKEAAAASNEPTLKAFLEARAEAFLSNEYRESDKAWMDVRGPIEVTIGPYETYADQLFGLKATFEAFVSLRDTEASKKLEVIGKQMDALERNLPIEAKYRGADRAQGSPIDVVHLLCNAGQSGVQTVAYNLPNDEHVRKEKGSKKVMMKNVLEGKFERIVKPIAAKVIADDQQQHLNFDAMFSYILMHEVAHGLGPGIITTADGKKTEVNKALKEQYAAIEEAKADIAGLVSAHYLVDRGIFPKAYEKAVYVAYLATVFRQVRFGVGEAHGRGAVASFNYLVEKGGIVHDASTGRYGIDFKKIKGAVRELAAKYLSIEARGDYEGAKAFLTTYAVMSPGMKTALDSAGTDVPVDIAPQFTVYEKMKSW